MFRWGRLQPFLHGLFVFHYRSVSYHPFPSSSWSDSEQLTERLKPRSNPPLGFVCVCVCMCSFHFQSDSGPSFFCMLHSMHANHFCLFLWQCFGLSVRQIIAQDQVIPFFIPSFGGLYVPIRKRTFITEWVTEREYVRACVLHHSPHNLKYTTRTSHCSDSVCSPLCLVTQPLNLIVAPLLSRFSLVSFHWLHFSPVYHCQLCLVTILFSSPPSPSFHPLPPPPPTHTHTHTHIHPYSLCSSHKRENPNRRPIYKSSWTTCHFQQQQQKSGISILRMCCVVPVIFNLTVSHFQVTFEPHITDMYLTTLP